MNKKKITAILISAVAASLLSGCGAGGRAVTPDADAAAAVSESVEDTQTAQTKEEDGVVETNAGLIQGVESDGIYSFLGVPYAEAAERFVPAGEVTPWEGIRVADSYGAMSPQGAILGMQASGEDDGTDNNCQNLNIWTPEIGDGGKRPVMVWLHGGGFSTGTANESVTNGKNLSESGDVVVVTVNHRLNVYGHLDLSAYGDKYKYSGNVGVTDIAASLEWIQDNIEAFGGDPENVTVFGQSGGGAKVLSLMTSPYASGLFQKGIVQSGATETMGVTFSSKEASEALTGHVLDNLGISADNIEELQTVSNARLQEAATQALQTTADEFEIPAAFGDAYAMEWGPVIDGDYMPTNPVLDEGFADAGRDIPLLIGSNLNEWTTFMQSSAHTDMTEEEIGAFASAYPDEEVSGAQSVDTLIRLPMLKIMSHKADQNGAPVYAYVFTWKQGEMGSYHGAEIPFVFDNLAEGEAEQKLADTVSQAWVNFAKTGTPSAEDLPEWEAYDRENGATMLLDTESELVHNHDRELMGLLAPDYVY